MMYEDVVKKLRRCTQFKCRGCEYEYVMSCRARLNEDAASAIEELNRAVDWIPCSERLPEERSDWKNVTVIDESGDTTYIYASVGFYLSEGCWIVDNEPMDDDSSIRVLAWASLPEPYKPPKEDKT